MLTNEFNRRQLLKTFQIGWAEHLFSFNASAALGIYNETVNLATFYNYRLNFKLNYFVIKQVRDKGPT